MIARYISSLLTFAFSLTIVATMARAETIPSKYVRQAANADTVIVFVHGVIGDAVSTWTAKNGTYWPALLAKDPTFDGADIYVYSYATGYWGSLSIDELAENMRADFVANGIAGYKKIIFLSHSMGGLITRAYLLKTKEVAAHTLFAYFYSTPTTGSQIASLMKFLSSNPQFGKMRSLNAEDYLADVLRQWLAARYEFPSYCAYEKRQTAGFSIVSMASAAALCTRALDPIDADHIDIVKPENQNSMSYMVFKAAYADAKIPDLNSQLNLGVSRRLRSEV